MAWGIRMIVAGRDFGWIEQDGKPVLFPTQAEAEEYASHLSVDATYVVAEWPTARV